MKTEFSIADGIKPQEPLISVDKAMKGEMNSENKKRNREGAQMQKTL